MLDALDGNEPVGELCKAEGLAHHRRYVQTEIAVNEILRRRQYQLLMLLLNIGYAGSYIPAFLVVHYYYGARHSVVAHPFLLGHILFDQEAYSLRTIAEPIPFDIFVELVEKLLFERYSEAF